MFFSDALRRVFLVALLVLFTPWLVLVFGKRLCVGLYRFLLGTSPVTVNEQTVIVEERERVAVRRRRVFGKKDLSADAVKDDLVGLALSGGGIRSAMFNLGLLQAFFRAGLFRFFDYLSTVSGGSYLGASLTSSIHAAPPTRAAGQPSNFPFAEQPDGSQPETVRRFIRGGHYLERPWELAFRYLLGLCLNLLVFCSGVVCLCAAVACFWRFFDQEPLRRFCTSEPSPQGWRHKATPDLVRAFVPCVLFLGAWWLTRRAARWAERRAGYGLTDTAEAGRPRNRWVPWAQWLRRVERLLLPACAASVAVGFVVLAGNGDVSLGFLRHLVPDSWLVVDAETQDVGSLDPDLFAGTVRYPLYALGVVAAGLLALVLASFLLPGQPTGSLGGGPGLPTVALRRKAFSLLAVTALLCLPLLLVYLIARENVSGRATQGKYLKTVREDWRATDPSRPRVSSVRVFSRADVERESNRAGADQGGDTDYFAGLPEMSTGDRQGIVATLVASKNGAAKGRVADPDLNNPQPVDLAIQFDNPADEVSAWVYEASYILIRRWETGLTPLPEANRVVLKVAWFDPAGRRPTVWLRCEDDSDLPTDLDRFGVDVTWIDRGEDSVYDLKGRFSVLAANRPNAGRNSMPLPEAAPDSRPVWLPEGLTPYLTLTVPCWLKRLGGVGADESSLAAQDQIVRLRVFWASFRLFLLSGLLVSLNWTSMHAFYRARLAEHYIQPHPTKGRRLPLSDLDQVETGAPYPLFSGTLNLLGGRRCDERNWPFLFSPRYCGSWVTDYIPTGADLAGFDDLGEVIALSGAAVSPAQAESLSMAALLTLANVRTGQWLPHPVNGRRTFLEQLRRRLLGWPTALCLLIDGFRDAEDRLRCFVSDGGHSENLGLWPLLRRRCKLIVVSDAGQDEQHALDDFIKVCRRMRLYHGVKVYDLHADQPIDTAPLRLQPDRLCKGHFFLGRVHYPTGFMGEAEGEGYLIYLKPSITSDEENDLLRHFRHRHPFPHDPTLNQLFDEDTVESYRQLGEHIGQTLCRKLPAELRPRRTPDGSAWEYPTADPELRADELFWRYLVYGPRDDPSGSGSDGDVLASGSPERDARQALRRYLADAGRRGVVDEEVRRLLAGAARRLATAANGAGHGGEGQP
jgi:hypothetical protein